MSNAAVHPISKYCQFSIVLDLIADSDIVLDPRTSFTATKCFALIHRVCELGTIQGLSAKSAPAGTVHGEATAYEVLADSGCKIVGDAWAIHAVGFP